MDKSLSYIYLLRDKDNKKWFYVDFVYNFQGGELRPFWSSNLNDILCRGGDYEFKDIATSHCKYHSNKYSLNLEVVKIKKCIKYSEVN